MPKKFEPTIKDKVLDIGDDMNRAYDIKAEEIRERYADDITRGLTDAEIRAAQRVGIIIGVFVLILILLWFLSLAGWK